MIRLELNLFEMQRNGALYNPAELNPSSFGKTPERPNAGGMCIAPSEYIIAMVNAAVFMKADTNQVRVARIASFQKTTVLLQAVLTRLALT